MLQSVAFLISADIFRFAFVIKIDVKLFRELQNILRSHGVTLSGQKKCYIISLCRPQANTSAVLMLA